MRKVELAVTGEVGSGKSTVLSVAIKALREAGYAVEYKTSNEHTISIVQEDRPTLPHPDSDTLEYQEGYVASQEGAPAWRNPYPIVSSKFITWKAGWNKAESILK